MTQSEPVVPMVSVPADLLTRACQLLGKLPAEVAAQTYVELLACKAVVPAGAPDP